MPRVSIERSDRGNKFWRHSEFRSDGKQLKLTRVADASFSSHIASSLACQKSRDSTYIDQKKNVKIPITWKFQWTRYDQALNFNREETKCYKGKKFTCYALSIDILNQKCTQYVQVPTFPVTCRDLKNLAYC